jgi:hypothetical protein
MMGLWLTHGRRLIVAVPLVILVLERPAHAQEDVAETAAKTVIDTTPIVEAPITAADREHWAFRPITRPPLPVVKRPDGLRTAVDAFILAKLDAANLSPAREASRPTLLRRLSFDLLGLPPTPSELAAFENDTSADAYERLADRLLASPAYGERWGQHWLDLARFAETDGFEHDKVRPEAWRYRDWVIAALNADMPYDEFVTRQIAGDATTFCLAGPDMPDINDQVERRHNLLNELTATVGSVLLGLQMGCAQCHDHKYDPISQADFYRLRAVFESGVPPLKRDVPYNALTEQKGAAQARFWVRGDHRRPGPEVQPGYPRIASQPDGAAGRSSGGAQRADFAQWLFQTDNPLTARVMANRLWQHHFGRGIFDTPSDVGTINAGPSHPELLDWLAAELRGGGWSLKRLHRGIVVSATYRQISDLKLQMTDLDANNSSNPKSEIRNLPSASLYTHFPRRRLDGESLRDGMLAAAGLLSGGRGGPGVMPPLPPELVGTLLKDQWKTSPREADHYRRSIYLFARRNLRFPIFEAFDRPDANASCAARNRSTTAPQSLLLFNSQFSLLAARHLAGRIVRNQESGAGGQEPGGQVQQLYLLALSRLPTDGEAAALVAFLKEQRERLAAEGRPRDQLALPASLPDSADPYPAAALVDACLAILNASEFLYVD